MSWVRFDPGFTRNRKRLDASPTANWLWISSVDYCVQHLTDGFLPDTAVSSLVPSLGNRARGACVEELLQVRAWERRDNGYLVHAFLEYQDSAEHVRKQREAGKERAKRFRER